MNDRSRKAIVGIIAVAMFISFYLIPARTVPTLLMAITLTVLLSAFFTGFLMLVWRMFFPSAENRRNEAIRQAELAAERGELRRALEIYRYHRLHTEAIGCLADHLPPWKESRKLIDAVDQLFRLQEAVTVAAREKIVPPLTAQLEEEVERAIQAILESADRFAAAGRQLDHYEPLEAILRPKGERLEQLSRACWETRTTLARQTLRGADEADLEEAEIRMSALEEAIRDFVDYDFRPIDR